MRKLFSVLLLISIGLIATTARADTIHFKNGSVLKGKVISFADDQFVVLLDTGSGRYLSRAMIYMGDVARIEFDSAQGVTSGADNDSANANSNDKPVRDNDPAILPSVTQPRVEIARNAPPPGDQPRASESQPPAREPEPSQPDNTSTPPTPTPEKTETEPSPRKLTGLVRTANIDVIATRDWTSTGLIVKRGDLIRINANGSVTLNPDTEQASGPEGIDAPDPRKLMPDRPTGALIGVIGADNDDFIFIGRTSEFTAVRDGLLFLSINEGTLSDNQGSYKALIELQVQGTSNQ
ncbi:MAG: hypothetical protein L0229_13040 [Blastocatellia bacterium]|nr:hypothetical protein [Blastocatellia bacterium]